MTEERLARMAEIIKNIVPIKKDKQSNELTSCVELCETMKSNGFTKEQAKMNLKNVSNNNIIKNKALNYVFDKENNND